MKRKSPADNALAPLADSRRRPPHPLVLCRPAATQDVSPKPPNNPQVGAIPGRARRSRPEAAPFALDTLPHAPIIDP